MRAAGCCTTTPTSGAARRRSTSRTTASGRPAAPGSAITSGNITCSPATATSWAGGPIPVMKDAALFFVDVLVKDPRTGWLISTPSNSPEQGGLVAGPTMDHQLIRDLFANTAQAAAILGVDLRARRSARGDAGSIAPNQVGQHGQLQEWLEDKDDPKNQHRHVSHLWGLHPGSEITPRGTPALAAAARQSLVFRGDGGTGWSKAWKINFWARFLDGDHAHKMLDRGPRRGTPCPTSSTPIPRSRSTATSAAPRASPRCSSKATPARSSSCPPCPAPGRTARSRA